MIYLGQISEELTLLLHAWVRVQVNLIPHYVLQFLSWENTSLLEDLNRFCQYDVAKAHKEHSAKLQKSQKCMITAPLLEYMANTNY
jgi:hypothetical protein